MVFMPRRWGAELNRVLNLSPGNLEVRLRRKTHSLAPLRKGRLRAYPLSVYQGRARTGTKAGTATQALMGVPALWLEAVTV